jgi:hypothetical protein
MVTWSYKLGQNSMTVGVCGRGLLHLMVNRKKREKKGLVMRDNLQR